MAGTPTPPTRIISWQQQVTEADPLWNREYQKPWAYQFSDGRKFYWTEAVYT